MALATDLNPGGGFSPSMPFVMTLACFGMNMTLEEALVGATLNAAASLDRAGSIGSLEAGKQIDAVIVSGTLADLVRVGGPVITHVIKRGRVAHTRIEAVTSIRLTLTVARSCSMRSPAPNPRRAAAPPRRSPARWARRCW